MKTPPSWPSGRRRRRPVFRSAIRSVTARARSPRRCWRCGPHSPRGGDVMRLRHEPLDLETTFEFRISVGASRGYANTLVRIEHEGIEGLGEASPSHYYGESRPLVEAALARWGPCLGNDPFALDAIERRMDEALLGHGAAHAAIEMAL